MDLLNKPISQFNFDDISNFCSQGYIEGYQLDYKQEFPSKGLAKHFAAFSNTRGGIIIIGVEEEKNGKPVAWNGIKDEEKLVERIHQYATNVEPIPSYDVHKTDERNGNVFILIRIFEGDRTPYYVQNDSNLWVRTGSISNPIDIASPDHIELLFGKKNKAEIARNNYIKRAFEIYDAALLRAEKERVRYIAEEKNEFERKRINEPELKYTSLYLQNKLGTNVSMLTLITQPFYPKKALITPVDLANSINTIKVKTQWIEFPSSDLEPIPDGLLKFYWGYYDGMIECEQIYSNGLLYRSIDVLKPDKRGNLTISMYRMVAMIMIFLKALKNFYALIKYQGGIIGFINLKNVNDVLIHKIIPQGWDFYGDSKKSLLSEYNWDLELDTIILNNDLMLQDYFLQKIKDICWDFGYKPGSDELYKAYLKENEWLIE